MRDPTFTQAIEDCRVWLRILAKEMEAERDRQEGNKSFAAALMPVSRTGRSVRVILWLGEGDSAAAPQSAGRVTSERTDS